MQNTLCTMCQKNFKFGSVSFCLVLNSIPFCLRVGKQKEAFHKTQIKAKAIHTMTRVLVWIRLVHVKTKRYRKAKAQQTSQLHPGQLFSSREKEEMPWVGFEHVHIQQIMFPDSNSWNRIVTEPSSPRTHPTMHISSFVGVVSPYNCCY